MCLLSSVVLHFDFTLNEALWLAYLDLKLVDVNPTYVSTLLAQVTVARYTMSLARHSPSRGHAAFLGQLYFFSVMGSSLFLSIFLLYYFLCTVFVL